MISYLLLFISDIFILKNICDTISYLLLFISDIFYLKIYVK